MKAFIRLAEKLKKLYPRLPILLLTDGLYPNDTVFNTCLKYGYRDDNEVGKIKDNQAARINWAV